MKPARDGWIDTLRALSALAVVLFHFNVLPVLLPPGHLAAAWHDFWSQGYLGVAVFFVLSGYCLVPGWQRSAGPGAFLWRRAWRILPPYWFSLLLIAVLAAGFKLVTGVNDLAPIPCTLPAIAATILLVTDPVLAVPAVNWVYWTLSFLLACYLLTSLALGLSRPRRNPALAGLHGVLCFTDMALHPEPHGAFFFVRHWPVFGLGIALALVASDRRAGWAMLACSALHFAWTGFHRAGEIPFLAAAGLTAAILALTRSAPFPRALQALAGLGRFSYSLYLVHVPVGIYLLMRLAPARFTSSWHFIAVQLLLLTATIAAARLFHLVGERPFLPRPRT